MNRELIKFLSKNWFSLILILFIIPLAIGLGIKYIDYIPILNDIPGDNGDWLGFWSGYLGSIIGIGGAYYVMKHQLKVEHNKELKDKEPLLVPGTAEYSNLCLVPGKDMIKDGKWIKDLKEFSEASFPLVNGGVTPIFDIRYSYTIENFEEYKKIFTRDLMSSEASTKMFIEAETHKKDILNYYYTYEDEEGHEIGRWIRKSNLSYLNFSPVIMPGESINFRLPITAIILLSYSFTNLPPYKKDMNERILLPKLTVNMNYKDYQLVDRVLSFEMSIQNYDTRYDNAEYRIAPKHLNYK